MIFAWDVRSSVSFAECLLLAELSRGKRVLEIGSWLGRSTIAIASEAESVTAVDWHQGDPDSGFEETLPGLRANLDRYGITNVEVIVARIEDAAHELDPASYDGVFIDAAHDVDSVRGHWWIAQKRCRPGGWVAFHDYGLFGVTEVVDELELIYAAADSLAVVRVP